MASVLVVGSGPSGVHFALTALSKGHQVTMLDVGHAAAEAPLDLAFDEIVTRAEDPVRYFLGTAYEGVVVPGREKEYYGFPPSKDHVFRRPPGFEVEARGFEPLFSFGRGGLAETWTGGCYPLDDGDLADFPFDYADIAPYYAEVARRIGVTGVKDDLAQFLPVHEHLMEPLRLDPHSAHLQNVYERRREAINGRLRCWLGRSRVAVLSTPREGRGACNYSGRCLWGCPTGALYTPSLTLEECRRYPSFTYRPSAWVRHLACGAERRLRHAVYESLEDGRFHEIAADRFVLAAGTLGSSSIYLNSVREATGQTVRLDGLMDNRQVLVPFLSPRFIGRPLPLRSYQYHQLALGLPGEHARDYVHGQITTLKTALAHPIIQALPLDLRTATFVFRAVRAGLGLVNVNLSDTRREDNTVSVRAAGDGRRSSLVIEYAPSSEEPRRLDEALRRVRRVLRRLGCIVPPGLAHVRPMGASVHYAGTVPMARVRGEHTASRHCRSDFFENLWFVDGTSFPFLPAKNLTFTLMANAVRVAEEAF